MTKNIFGFFARIFFSGCLIKTFETSIYLQKLNFCMMKLFTLLEFCLYVSKINVLGSLQKCILNSKHSFLLLLSKIKYHYQSFHLVLCHCVAPIIKTKIDIKIKCNKMETLLWNCIYDLQFRKRLFIITMAHTGVSCFWFYYLRKYFFLKTLPWSIDFLDLGDTFYFCVILYFWSEFVWSVKCPRAMHVDRRYVIM